MARRLRRSRRLPDWEQRLGDYLAEARELEHDYGAHDCLLHCAAAVKAATGVDLARRHRGKYRSAASASRYLASLGFASPAELVDSLLPERPPAFARRGDLVAGEDGIPGVCIGGTAVFVGMDGSSEGLVTTPRAEWVKAWTVGEA
ncbi:MAG: hypothetical protein M3N07_03460 [Pseudomonadota bacterium]|nr:hypothetical protein [Pseudomonadota bacterium]